MLRHYQYLLLVAFTSATSVAVSATDEAVEPTQYSVALAGLNDSESGFRIAPYGAFWADMVLATSRTNPGAFTFFVLSEEAQGEGTFTIDARRSRFGFDAFGPEIPIDGGLKSQGRVKIDFHGDFIIENRARCFCVTPIGKQAMIGTDFWWDSIGTLFRRSIPERSTTPSAGWAATLGFVAPSFATN